MSPSDGPNCYSWADPKKLLPGPSPGHRAPRTWTVLSASPGHKQREVSLLCQHAGSTMDWFYGALSEYLSVGASMRSEVTLVLPKTLSSLGLFWVYKCCTANHEYRLIKQLKDWENDHHVVLWDSNTSGSAIFSFLWIQGEAVRPLPTSHALSEGGHAAPRPSASWDAPSGRAEKQPGLVIGRKASAAFWLTQQVTDWSVANSKNLRDSTCAWVGQGHSHDPMKNLQEVKIPPHRFNCCRWDRFKTVCRYFSV